MNFLLPEIFETGKSFDDWFNEPLDGLAEKRGAFRRAFVPTC